MPSPDGPAASGAKLNAITDAGIVRALYRASRAGVPIDLIVRGMCVLRPGIPGVSDTIRVRSIVGRFLEHSRIFAFHNAGEREIFIGSADWMGRNLDRRVETVVPVLDPDIGDTIERDILDLMAADNVKDAGAARRRIVRTARRAARREARRRAANDAARVSSGVVLRLRFRPGLRRFAAHLLKQTSPLGSFARTKSKP